MHSITPSTILKPPCNLELAAAAAASAAATPLFTTPPPPPEASSPDATTPEGPAAVPGYPCQALAHVLVMLESWMHLNEAQAHLDEAAPLGTTLADSLTKELLEAILNAFSTATALLSAAPQSPLRAQLHHSCLELLDSRAPVLQLHVLATLFQVLRNRPAFIRWLRKLQLWDVLYGPHFFFLCGDPGSAQHRSTSTTDTTGGVARLQEWVVELTEVAASSRGSQTNEPECLKMLQLLEQAAAGDWRTLLLIAPCLDRLLWRIPEPTIQVCERKDALSYLGRSIQLQQQRASADNPDSTGRAPTEGRIILAARVAVLNLLGTMFELSDNLRRRAVRGWESVATLFSLLWEPRLRAPALRLLMRLMALPAFTDDDRLAKEMMFTKFVEALPRAKGQWREDRMVLLLDLLNALPSVLHHDRAQNQALLRNADALGQVVALLDDDYPLDMAGPLLLRVLRTLTTLMASNESSRIKFKNEVGYDTMLRAVLRATGDRQPSRELLLAVLGLALEQDYDPTSTSQVVANPDAAAVHLQLLRRCDEGEQIWGLALWGELAAQGLANLAALQRGGANGQLISWLAATTHSPPLQGAIAKLLQVTGAYSISGKDLRAILALLRPLPGGRAPHHAGPLLAMLRAMARHEGPSAFFDFSAPTAGIMRVDTLRWPSKGYTFATWLRVEADPHVPDTSQSLYSFTTRRAGTTMGVAARLQGGHLCIRFIGEKKTIEMMLKFVFMPRRWYHVVICHSSGSLALSAPQVRVYVDGSLQASLKLKYPHKVDTMTAITFATAVPPQDSGLQATAPHPGPPSINSPRGGVPQQVPVGAFTGQMGCLYLLEDVLSPMQVRMLYSLGPEYQGSFLPAEYSPTLSQASAAAAALLEGKEALGGRLLAGYCPQAAAGRMLLDMAALSGSRSSSLGEHLQQQLLQQHQHLGTAEVLQGTSLCLTCQLHDILNCVGGVKVLLPLVAQLDAAVAPPTPPPSPPSTPSLPSQPQAPQRGLSRSGDVMGLIEGVLRNSPAALQAWQGIGGFALVAHLLQQQSPRHLNVQLLEVLDAMWQWAGRMPSVAAPLLEHLLCNLPLWATAEASVQRLHQALLEKIIREDPSTLHQVLTVPRILAAVRAHYWVSSSPPDTGRPAAGGGLPFDELRLLRRSLLRIASVQACSAPLPQRPAGSHLVARDIQAFTAFAADCADLPTQEDVVEELCCLLQPASPVQSAVAALLAAQGGFLLLLPLLQREQASLRRLGLRTLQLLLAALAASPQPLAAAILSSITSTFAGGEEERAEGLWAAVSDKLLMFPLTREIRHVLLDIMCPPTRTPPSVNSHRLSGAPAPVAVRNMAVPQVMGTLCRLLQGCDDPTERLALLEALVGLLEGSRTNLEAVSQQPAWQEWLLALLVDGSPCNSAPIWPPLPSPRDISPPPRAPGSGAEAGGTEAKPRAAFKWFGDEAQLVRRLLRAMHVHCILHQQGGWKQLQRTACHIRMYAERGVVDGWGMVHEVVGDVVEGVLQAQDAAATDTWTLVPVLSVPPARGNVAELLALLDALLTGALIPPSPNTSPLPLTAVAWAKGNPTAPQDLTDDAWGAIGVGAPARASAANSTATAASIYTPSCWRLYLKAWGLVKVLQASSEVLPIPPKLQGVISRGGAALQESSVSLRALLSREGSTTSSPDLSLSSPMSEAAMAACAHDRLPRVAARLLLLHLQHAPLPQLQQIAEAGVTISRMLEAAGPAAWDRVHLLVAASIRCKNLLHPRNLKTASLGSVLVQPGDGSTARYQAACDVVADLVAGLKGPMMHSLKESLPTAPTPPATWDELAAGAMVHVERVVRCARAEILFVGHMGQASAGATQAVEAAQDKQHQLERQRLRSVAAASQDSVLATCTADHAVRAGLQAVADEQRQAVARRWKDLHRGLTSDRGVWASQDTGPLYWKLDPHEDRSRRRMKLKRNYRFVAYNDAPKGQAPARAEADLIPSSPSVLAAANGNAALEHLEEELEAAEAEHSSRPSTPGLESVQSVQTAGGGEEGAKGEGSKEGGEGEEMGRSASPDRGWEGETRETILQERVLLTTSCLLVTPKFVMDGRLELTPYHLHFCGEIAPPSPTSSSKSPGTRDGSSPEPPQQPRRRHRRWSLRKIREIHHSRYLLQPSALELFHADGSPVLLNFPSKAAAKDLARRITESHPQITFMDRGRKMEAALKLQHRWLRHEVTNFDYLMQLNTLAGRTYNDLNQYPVFPWVIADYSSPALDLTSPSTFRDLSKPVGIQSDKRRDFFVQRYNSMKVDGEMPAFHYGSHYSSAAIVLFYLLRLEPFTSLNRQLQGGRFDHADRLFHSVAGTWRNAQESSADVKELLPEFFNNPEFLLNSNAFNLGTKQDGERLSDVALPPWAGDSPEEFVRIQREALESDYVSDHLHLWIDLIFGTKQRGRTAEDAVNVFYYLTYEGAVDLSTIADLQERAAIEDQIRHFGQTPPQLFRRRHPKRNAGPPPPARPLLNAPEALRLVSVTPPSAAAMAAAGGRAYPVARTAVSEGRVVVVTADRVVASHRWISPRGDIGSYAFSTGGDSPFAVEADLMLPRSLGSHGDAGVQASGDAYCIIPGCRIVASCGYWDNSVKLNSWEDGRLLHSAAHHRDLVTCLAASPCCSLLATGSRDTTIALWALSPPSRSKSARPPLSTQPLAVLDGHDDSVVALALSTSHDLIVSASASGVLLFHTLSRGEYVRALTLPGSGGPAVIVLAEEAGLLAVHCHSDLAIHLFTLNGRHVTSADCGERLRAMQLSADGRQLVVGGDRGVVEVRWLHSLNIVHRYDDLPGTPSAGRPASVTALAVTPDDCILAGTSDGCVLLLAPEPRRLRSCQKLNLALPHVRYR